MKQEDRDVLRAKIVQDSQRMQDGMAPLYLGRSCPLDGHTECRGPQCSFFLPQMNEQGKVAGGACCIPLIASQIGPIADGLMQIAQASAQNAPRVIPTAPIGILK
jgi:hypothetical protein